MTITEGNDTAIYKLCIKCRQQSHREKRYDCISPNGADVTFCLPCWEKELKAPEPPSRLSIIEEITLLEEGEMRSVIGYPGADDL